MSRYGKETELNISEVLEKAIKFFGEDGLGLKITEKESDTVCFERAGGHVTVTACSNDKIEVDIVTKEWDYQVKEFMKNL